MFSDPLISEILYDKLPKSWVPPTLQDDESTARNLTKIMLRTVVGFITDAECDPKVRLRAIELMLERLHGKVPQGVEHSGNVQSRFHEVVAALQIQIANDSARVNVKGVKNERDE